MLRVIVVVLATILFGQSLPDYPAQAATPDAAAARVTEFYTTLLATMKMGADAGINERFQKLRPAIEAAFDIPAITAIVSGASWSGIDRAQRAKLIEAFDRMTVANYARNFDSFEGQRFEVNPLSVVRDNYRFVRSRMIERDGKAIAFDYLMHRRNGKWQIIDVYYLGTVSELATRRAEFSSVLENKGVQALIDKLMEIIDRLMAEK